ncbi:hypothetical protein VIGAN_04299500, partial [Vigna angularis var. angularis]
PQQSQKHSQEPWLLISPSLSVTPFLHHVPDLLLNPFTLLAFTFDHRMVFSRVFVLPTYSQKAKICVDFNQYALGL